MSKLEITAEDSYQLRRRLNDPCYELAQQFLRTEKAAEITNSTKLCLREKGFREEYLGELLSGRIFEELAYLYLLPIFEGPDAVFLSSDDTFWLYKRLHGGNVQHNLGSPDFHGLRKGIQEISYPDGLIFAETPSDWQITTVCEYKCSTLWRATSETQLNYFQNPFYLIKNLCLEQEQGGQKLGRLLAELLQISRSQTSNGCKDTPKPVCLAPDYDLIFATTNNHRHEIGIKKTILPIAGYEIAPIVDLIKKLAATPSKCFV